MHELSAMQGLGLEAWHASFPTSVVDQCEANLMCGDIADSEGAVAARREFAAPEATLVCSMPRNSLPAEQSCG